MSADDHTMQLRVGLLMEINRSMLALLRFVDLSPQGII